MNSTIRYRRQDGTLFLCSQLSGVITAYVKGEQVLHTSLPFNYERQFSIKELARACDEIRVPKPSNSVA